jgi:hypothetical protein
MNHEEVIDDKEEILFSDGERQIKNGIEIEVFGDGRKWFLDGKLHREDGPAVEFDFGPKFWYLYGKLHREDGPAIEWVNGSKEWYLNGKRFETKETFFKALRKKSKIKALFSESFMKA